MTSLCEVFLTKNSDLCCFQSFLTKGIKSTVCHSVGILTQCKMKKIPTE